MFFYFGNIFVETDITYYLLFIYLILELLEAVEGE